MTTTAAAAATQVNTEFTTQFIFDKWDKDIIPQLEEYIRIPNLSPAFDPEVLTNGHQDKAIDLMVNWVKEQPVKGMAVEVVRETGRTPVIFIEVEASAGAGKETVLLYGHMDKQPPFTGWVDGLEPYKPVIRDGKLYGRGGADDGYALYASLTAILCLQQQNIPHARCIVLIEASEESGSPDLPFYVEKLASRIGSPNLVVCLDSGCGNYEQLWVTTSLRGIMVAEMKVSLISEGVHSGSGSGVVADSFRVARILLERLEDPATGKIICDDFHVTIPEDRIEQARACAAALGESVVKSYPLREGVIPICDDPAELLLNKTWRPTLTVTGSNLPPMGMAGNVLRPETELKLSIRVPPGVDVGKAEEALKELLTKDVPYGAKVEVTCGHSGNGWSAPPVAEWLETTLQNASKTFFDGKPCIYTGEGGSIPFIGMLGVMFPQAQFCITGLLGPHSNAHGPNEFLHILKGKRLTCAVTSVLADHAKL